MEMLDFKKKYRRQFFFQRTNQRRIVVSLKSPEMGARWKAIFGSRSAGTRSLDDVITPSSIDASVVVRGATFLSSALH
jgi:hypothetical protein